MAYTQMKKNHKVVLAILIFLVNVAIVCSQLKIGILTNLIGATSLPILIYVVPGYLYHMNYKANLSEQQE